MELQFFNTLGRGLQNFEPSEKDQVKFYSCGPTVYDYVHIGNLRAYIFADTVKRALEFNGQDVNWVMNITDLDDKTIARAIKQSGPNAAVADLRGYTDQYFQLFLADLEKVNIAAQDISFVKVTDKIADIQLFILELLNKGYAYKAEDGSTYFNISKYQQDFGDYGQLVGEKFLEGKKIGARVKVDEYEKDDLSDFALWKAHSVEDGRIFWDHPALGPGRPGWHIECTLINYFKFPNGTDIHSGGVDLIFPHHTNEIAQAQPIYRPFVRYWLHSEHILVDNKKMAKSAGNFFTLHDLETAGITDGLALRYLYLQSHYRSKLNVTKASLSAAKKGLQRLYEEIAVLLKTAPLEKIYETAPNPSLLSKFTAAINSDLNLPEALALISIVLKSELTVATKLATIFKMDEVFGLNLEKAVESAGAVPAAPANAEVQELLERRSAAKAKKDFELADRLRDEIESKGYEISDTPGGPQLKPKAK